MLHMELHTTSKVSNTFVVMLVYNYTRVFVSTYRAN